MEKNTPIRAAAVKLAEFILNDEDMRKLTQKQIRGLLKLTSCAISDYMESISLGDVISITDTDLETTIAQGLSEEA